MTEFPILRINYTLLCIYTISIHLLMDTDQCCILAMAINSVMLMGVELQHSHTHVISCGYKPKSHKCIHLEILLFLKNSQCFPQWLCCFISSPAKYKDSHCCTTSPTLSILSLLDNGHRNKYTVTGFSFCLSTVRDRNPFIHLMTIYVFFWKLYLQIICSL